MNVLKFTIDSNKISDLFNVRLTSDQIKIINTKEKIYISTINRGRGYSTAICIKALLECVKNSNYETCIVCSSAIHIKSVCESLAKLMEQNNLKDDIKERRRSMIIFNNNSSIRFINMLEGLPRGYSFDAVMIDHNLSLFNAGRIQEFISTAYASLTQKDGQIIMIN